jgi:hypothetical protein
MKSECAPRFVAELTHRGGGGAQIVERGSRGRVQSLSCLGETNTARRPLNERDTEPLFESLQRLTYG